MRLFHRHSQKIGMSPGSYIFLGEKKQEKVQLNLMDYDESRYEFTSIENVEDAFPSKDKKSISWINVYGLHEVEMMKKLEQQFNIHPLVMEDILNTAQRPKIEIYDDYLFIVIKMIYFDDETAELEVEQISLILYDNFIICFQERKGDMFNPLRERIKNSKGRIRKRGADYLAYAILDVIVDNYFLVLENIGDQIEAIDEALYENLTAEMANRINLLKRTLIHLRKNLWPLRELINMLTRDEVPYFHSSTVPFLRDLYDHTIQVIDTTESFREMVSGLMDMYMTAISNRMNEIMKVLTIIATIFIPLSFLAGIYGMNFDVEISSYNMPELGFRYGYLFFWLLVLLIGGGLLFFFRRKRWI